MNLQLVYRYILSLSENEKMFKKKTNETKQTDQTIAPRQLMFSKPVKLIRHFLPMKFYR